MNVLRNESSRRNKVSLFLVWQKMGIYVDKGKLKFSTWKIKKYDGRGKGGMDNIILLDFKESGALALIVKWETSGTRERAEIERYIKVMKKGGG